MITVARTDGYMEVAKYVRSEFPNLNEDALDSVTRLTYLATSDTIMRHMAERTRPNQFEYKMQSGTDLRELLHKAGYVHTIKTGGKGHLCVGYSQRKEVENYYIVVHNKMYLIPRVYVDGLTMKSAGLPIYKMLFSVFDDSDFINYIYHEKIISNIQSGKNNGWTSSYAECKLYNICREVKLLKSIMDRQNYLAQGEHNDF